MTSAGREPGTTELSQLRFRSALVILGPDDAELLRELEQQAAAGLLQRRSPRSRPPRGG